MTEIIAIDGPASAGKSSIAKKISKKFNAPILFSGKLYRAVALELINRKLNQ
jgi:cytidylate kinase